MNDTRDDLNRLHDAAEAAHSRWEELRAIAGDWAGDYIAALDRGELVDVRLELLREHEAEMRDAEAVWRAAHNEMRACFDRVYARA